MNTPTTNPIIVVVPGKSYWRLYWFLAPLAGVYLGGPLVVAINLLLHKKEPWTILLEVLVVGVIMALLIAYVSIRRDKRKLRCSLYADRLVLGGGSDQQEVLFHDIESIVVGLPRRLSWFLRLGTLHPAGGAVIALRATAVVIRIKERRALALNLSMIRATNTRELLDRFVELNADKFMRTANYTPEEEKAFSKSIPMNKIITY
jgi:hypothetical protein